MEAAATPPLTAPALPTPDVGASSTYSLAAVAAAEQALATLSYKQALEMLDAVRIAPSEAPGLALRAAVAEAAARLELGDVQGAHSTLDAAAPLVDLPDARDRDRAAFMYELGAAKLALGLVAEASSLLTLALDVTNRSPIPDDRLRALILERRARCHRHHRDWRSARADVERALELAEALGDERTVAQACLQASIVCEREGQWIMAQFYAERARALFVGLGDVFGVGRCLNNLGGLAFLLGRTEDARRYLNESFGILLDLGRDVEAAYAISSLAQVQLRSGEFEEAERLARRALVFIGSRVDHRVELGNAQLVLGRSLLEQGRLDEADDVFSQAEHALERAAIGERAAVWIAQGEASTARGDTEGAAALYRRAAEALQDFHF
jgi:tetratricopeptide (TPR) repeat protein